MKRDVAAILNEALKLPGDARAALAEALLASLDSHVDQDNESAWAAEIDRRVAELDAGTVSTIPWAEVRNRLFERARHRAIGRLRNGLDLHWVPGSREELHRR
jgi:putative addiction module component (TIGR02574 family)